MWASFHCWLEGGSYYQVPPRPRALPVWAALASLRRRMRRRRRRKVDDVLKIWVILWGKIMMGYQYYRKEYIAPSTRLIKVIRPTP